MYGMSPLRSALRNINSQNSAIELGVQTLQNGGAFGFIHGKSTALDAEQAQSLKDRLVEMQASKKPLGRIAG
ncbi:phage portal protein, partial [Streptococcus pneumoniae]|uniref:phage portal protein n=1 Tax=Streptococcus pneumoniae TaxID=1313 RepID=UPI001CBFE0B0